jgi:hypothetical protein
VDLVEPVRSDFCRRDPEAPCTKQFVFTVALAPERGVRPVFSGENDRSQQIELRVFSRSEFQPLRQCGCSVIFEEIVAVEVTFLIEMIVDRSMN